MVYRNLNGLRTIQVMIKETGLYKGGIDGKVGPGTLSSLQALVSARYALTTGRSLGVYPQTPFQGDISDVALAHIQDLLKAAGVYQGEVDGKYGNGTYMGVYQAYRSYIEQNKLPLWDACWSKKVTKAFVNKIKAWVKLRGYPTEAVNWLLACMAWETGRTFSPSIQNQGGSKAFGLIQFMEPAAKDLGIPLDVIRRMDQLAQLDVVFQYFDMWAKRGKTYTQLEDFYLTIFYPAAVGTKADQNLFTLGGSLNKSYVQNKGFDLNNDGVITVGEISSRLYDVYFEGMDTANRVYI